MTKTQIIKANANIISEYCLDSDEDKLVEGLLVLIDIILTKQMIEELKIMMAEEGDKNG